MNGQDILNNPWAIIPAKLVEIQAVYMAHLQNNPVDIAAVEEKLGKPLKNERKPYQVIDGVALLEVEGIIAKRMNLLTQISGGTSTQILKADFMRAFTDPEVKAIVLIVDSPGGTVDGTEEMANAIYQAREKATKPIVTYVDGMMASAAYWIGSAADRIYINGQTANVGSIGVVASHVDYSKYEENQGIKTTEIFAGKYKRIASEYQPLSKEGKAYIQDRVDQLYSIFVNKVSQYRQTKLKISGNDLIPWAEGKLFIGQQGIEAGLADGIASLEMLVSDLSRGGRDGLVLQQVRALTKQRLDLVADIAPVSPKIPAQKGMNARAAVVAAVNDRMAILAKMKKHHDPIVRFAYFEETQQYDFAMLEEWARSFAPGSLPAGATFDQLGKAFGELYPQYRANIAEYALMGSA